jgi:hypothetical protein
MFPDRFKVCHIMSNQMRRPRGNCEVHKKIIVWIACRGTPEERNVMVHGKMAKAVQQVCNLLLAHAKCRLFPVQYFVVLKEQRVY